MVSCQSKIRSGPTAGQQQYGLAIGSLQARKFPRNATCGRRIPRPRDKAKFSNPARFDKITSRAIHQPLTGAAGNAAKKLCETLE
jgi:hypothetical protein